MFVSDGAMANMPIEMMFLSSNTGRQVMPLFVDFQMPPPAAATNNVFDGPGIPTTSERRPMKLAGPTVRQRKPDTMEESSACADTGAANAIDAHAPAKNLTKRVGYMGMKEEMEYRQNTADGRQRLSASFLPMYSAA